MSCRQISSPINGERVSSKLWSEIRALVDSDTTADSEYLKLLSPEIQEKLGDWINNKSSVEIYDTGEPTIKFVSPLLGDTFQQKEGVAVPSKASPKTISLIKEFLKRAGIDVQALQSITGGVNGLAIPMKALLQIAEGKENVALPEEAMHIAVAIIKQTNPKLYNEMLNRIGNYNIYESTFQAYKNEYKTPEGKPDVRKIKEEAVAKLLVEHIINLSEGLNEKPENLAQAQTWWQKIVEFFKGLFNKAGFNPFEEAAKQITEGEIGTAKDIREEENTTFLQKSEDIYNKIKEQASKITKTDEGYEINGNKVKRRVTELAKAFYERTFKSNEITKSQHQKAVDDLKKENGTKGHSDVEHAFHQFVDENGNIRAIPLPEAGYTSQINPKDNGMYNILKKNLQERIKSFPAGTKFMSEVTVYDAKKDEAGTMDFIAITPDGKVNILDWKFIDLNLEKADDVPWYKVRAWRIQIGEYKRILKDVYGVKAEDFGQTRAVPIIAHYDKQKNQLPTLEAVEIGDVNVKNEAKAYLLPVGLEEETTGNKKLDTLIEKLNRVYDTISDTPANEKTRAGKIEQLNSLFTAIRQLQIRRNIHPLIKQAKVLNKEINQFIKDFNESVITKDINSYTEAERSDIADRIEDYIKFIDTYTNIDLQLRELISEDNKELKSDLRDVADEARELKSILSDGDSLDGISERWAKKIGESVGVDSLLSPERIVKGIQRWFSSTSEIPIKTLQAIFKKRREAKQLTDIEVNEENQNLINLEKEYNELSQRKGWGIKNKYDILKKKDKNELIDQYQKEFYTTLKEKIASNDVKWMKENIDVQKVKDYMKEKLEEEYERIESKYYTGTKEEINKEINALKEKAKKQWDVSTDKGLGWYNYNSLRKFPISSWNTKEWNELNAKGNESALTFYKYIEERNKYYASIDYISNREARVFLPFVPRTLIEKAVYGGKITLGESILRSMSVDESTIGYGSYDPLTGEPVNKIPKYLTKEIQADLSTDLFRTMALYNEVAIRYKYLSDIEGQVRSLARLERNKKAIQTSMFGKVQKDALTGKLKYVSNEENAKLVEEMSNALIYDRRYIDDAAFDQTLGKIGTWGKSFNDKLGMKIFPEDLSGRQISLNRSVDTLNRIFQQKVLGINILSSMSNFLGGNFQAFINSGKYFNKTDFVKSEFTYFGSKLQGEEGKKIAAAFEYFMPFTENYNRRVMKQLSDSKLSQESIQDVLMLMMRQSDLAVQGTIFLSLLKNAAIIDGNIVNARQYITNSDEFKNRYSLPYEERRKLEISIDEKVKSLIEEKGALKLAKVNKEGKLEIPGVDRTNKGVINLRQTSQHLSKDALGNLTEDEVRKIQLNVYGKSFMIFKSWIPRLIDVRIGALKYNSASDAYEWGRIRTVFNYLSFDLIKSIRNLHGSLAGTQRGIEYMRKLYEKKQQEYKDATGEDLNMTEGEFFDMVRQNISSQMRDVLFYTFLMGMYFSWKTAAPDKDEDPKVKNYYKYTLRALDKFSDEVGFFYNPQSIQQIVVGSTFPSLSMFTDMSSLLQNFGKDMYGAATGNGDMQKSAHSIKYIMKMFPVTNQIEGYLPMLYPDLAKELGISLSSQSRMH